MLKKDGRFLVPKSKITDRLPFILFGIFLILSTIIAALAAITVLYPHVLLAGIWTFKKEAFHQLLHFQLLASEGFAVLSVLLGLAAIGWFRNLRLAWILSFAILLVNLVSDLVHMFIAKEWIDILGILFEGLILYWLSSTPIRKRFFLKSQ